MSEMAERALADLARAGAEAAVAVMTSGTQGSVAELFTRTGGGSALGGLAREAGEAGPAAAGPAWSGGADLTAEAGSESGLGEASSEPGESGPALPGLEHFVAAELRDIGPVRETVSGDSAGDTEDTGDDTEDNEGTSSDDRESEDSDASDSSGAADEPGQPAGDEGESRAVFPAWLGQVLEACEHFAADNIPLHATSMRINEVRLASGLVLDSYVPNSEIVKRENSQLAEVGLDAAHAYVDSCRRMYDSGEMIADTLANRATGIAGDALAGRHILELPPQAAPIPPGILHYAASYEVIIRDTDGKVYP
jgi:hypothetical protein